MNRTWSPLPTHDGGQKVTETQAVSPSRCKDRILLTWNTSPLTVAPMSSEADREQEDSITHCSAYNKQGPTLVTEPTSAYIRVCVLTSTYTDIMYT